MDTTQKVVLDNTEGWVLHSQKTGYSYNIKVAFPPSPPNEDRYPIIYILDGNSYFQFARDVVRLQSKNAPKTLVNEAIIVGIGHSGEDKDASKRRFLDFTAPAESYTYPDRLNGRDLGDHGGAGRFLEFIQEELKPEIESRYSINKEKQALFGHSLSGLFTLWTLFTAPNTFQTYLAVSPSIWWNNHEMLGFKNWFSHQTKEDKKRRLFMSVGKLEGFMVEDARKLLEQLRETQHLFVDCDLYVAPEENHASVVPTVMSKAIRFANEIK
ncbi:alpha/beta hydrolase [Cytobacillus solani]|uniref:alpha/beta hydrolase n=1 Tax=Cytobacillus solani TaxID=1637975 RepID=UPI00207A2F18|nr:alpha/beta hydrolase-fold protein [Cytobacillus solani]USK56337.1 alpha/beta hydrolase [Cytobacillus solani]